MEEIVAMLKEAPDSELDASMVEEIKLWSNPPTALQVLNVTDRCVYSALASGFMMQVLDMLLEMCMEREKTTFDELIKLATWREGV